MKLNTKIVEGHVHMDGACIDLEFMNDVDLMKLKQDAAKAHALLTALEKAGFSGTIVPAAQGILKDWNILYT